MSTRTLKVAQTNRGVHPADPKCPIGDRPVHGRVWLVRRIPHDVTDGEVLSLFSGTMVGEPGDFVIPFDALGLGYEWRQIHRRPTRVYSRQLKLVPHGPRSAQWAVLINGGPWGCRFVKRWRIWTKIEKLPEPLRNGHGRPRPELGPDYPPTVEMLQHKLDGKPPAPASAPPSAADLVAVTEELGRRIAKRPEIDPGTADKLKDHLTHALRALGS